MRRPHGSIFMHPSVVHTAQVHARFFFTAPFNRTDSCGCCSVMPALYLFRNSVSLEQFVMLGAITMRGMFPITPSNITKCS